MKAYAEYKPSGVEWLGEVPSHWQAVKSKNIFGQSSQRALKNDEQLTASQKYGVIPQRLFMEYENQKVVLALTGLDNFKHIDKNDFVISLRSFQGGIELCHYDGCVSPAYTVLKAKSEINNNYFSYLLKDIVYIQALNTAVIGIREGKNISYNNFGEIFIPLPPLAEQQKIAQFLDTKTAQIDALITEQNRLIELLTEQRKAVISHAVTKGLNPNAPMKKSGVEWLGEVPSHWNDYPFWAVFKEKSITNQIHENLLSVYLDKGVIPYSEGGGLVHKPSESLEKYQLVEQGDFVMNNQQAWRGSVGISVYKGIVSPAYLIFKPNKNLFISRYLHYLLRDKFMVSQFEVASLSVGTIQRQIKNHLLRKVKVFIPPLAEQQKIAQFLDTKTAQIDALITEQKELIERLKEYRTALISAAVTGKIDIQAA